jgi:hypothetical protein
MGFLKKLGSLFSPSSGDSRSLWLFVKCEKCGEILKGRVDLYNDLSAQYEESGTGTSYFCRKVFVGSNRCYRPIEVELTFDKNKRLLNQEVTGGEIVSKEAYLVANPEADD